MVEHGTTCDQRGEAHRVNERELREAREHGGWVTCLSCGKRIEQGPLNLEFRAPVIERR
jgi:hypothetical protein